MNILIVEDDPAIGRAVEQGFTQVGHTCDLVRDGDAGLAAAATQRFDAVILDVMLPGLSGLDVLRRLREGGLRMPVILVTALGTIEERVAGLQAGADDYIVKPFAFAELAARLDAVSRRATPPAPVLKAGDWTLNLTSRRAECGGQYVNLTPIEFSVLEMLVRHVGQVVTRQMLCEHVWESQFDGETNVIDVHINRLRGKTDRAGQPGIIQTVRGRGYVLRTP